MEKNQKAKTNKTVAFSYAMGSVGSNISWYIINNYLTLFYTDIVTLSASAISLIMLVARVWDAVNDPMMGLIVDRTKSRWGKFRPYLMFGPPFLAVFNILTFTVFPVKGAIKVALCLICYILAGMAYTAVGVAYNGLLNRLSNDSQVRMDYVTAAQIGSSIIQVILSASIMPMILFFGKSDTANAKGFFISPQNTVLITIITAAIGFAGASASISFGMMADCIVYGEYKFGVRDEGFVTSFQTLSVKLGGAIVGAVAIPILFASGYVAGTEQTETAKTMINMVVNVMPAVLNFIAIIPLFWYKLDEKKVAELTMEIEQRQGE